MSQPRLPPSYVISPECAEVAAELAARPRDERHGLVADWSCLWRLDIAAAVLEIARDLPPEEREEADSLVLLTLAIVAQVDVEADKLVGKEAADLQVEAWAYRAELAAFRGRLRSARLFLGLAEATADLGTGSPEVGIQLASSRSWLLWFEGKLDLCLAVLDRGIASAVECGQTHWEAGIRWRKAAVLQAAGRLGEAHAEAAAVLALDVDMPEMRAAVEKIYAETRDLKVN